MTSLDESEPELQQTAQIASAPKRRKVALVGTAPSSAYAPFNDPSYEVWGVGFRGEHVKRADRWYEVHNLALEKDGTDWPPLLVKWSHDCDVWMFHPQQMPQLGAKAKQYPLDFMLKRHDPRFLTSSFSYMCAHAIWAHELGEPAVDEIGVWGVDMESGTEYEQQRIGFFYFKDIALQRGIEFRMPPSCGLAWTPLPYPYFHDDAMTEKLRSKLKTMEDMDALHASSLDKMMTRIAHLGGVIEGLAMADLETTPPFAAIEKAKADKAQLESGLPTIRTYRSELKGGIEMMKWFLRYIEG